MASEKDDSAPTKLMPTAIEVEELDEGELTPGELESLRRMQSAPDAITVQQRARGTLLGLAVGDALGTTLEFKPPGSFSPIADMVGGGPFQLQPGEWTDDTAMAFCLGTSLVERNEFDPLDQMQRYLRWYREGAYSSNGRCFDVGSTVAKALNQFEELGNPFAGSTDPQRAGNGSLMRLAPIPMAFLKNPRLAIRFAADMSRTTHATVEAIDACRFYAGLIIGALQGVDKATLLAPKFSPVPNLWEEAPLSPLIDEVAAGSYWHKEPPRIIGSGYVVESLEAALWAFAKADSFREGVLLAVNLGDDADTTGAVYGQLAGAYYGIDAIPTHWLDVLARREELQTLANRLIALDADEMEKPEHGGEAQYDINTLDATTDEVTASWFIGS